MVLPTYFTLFYIFIKNINCVTRNKVALNERIGPVKHINIIQGKTFFYGFKY